MTSVIVRRCRSGLKIIIIIIYIAPPKGTSTPALPLIADLRHQRHQRPFIVPLRLGDLPCLALNTVIRLHPTTPTTGLSMPVSQLDIN